MQIEIITTKKKLTKALISQMHRAHLEVLQQGEVLGYIINTKKDVHKLILILYNNEYYIIEANWTLGELAVYRKIGKWTQKKEFKTTQDKLDWWVAYQNILEKATIHIYI